MPIMSGTTGVMWKCVRYLPLHLRPSEKIIVRSLQSKTAENGAAQSSGDLSCAVFYKSFLHWQEMGKRQMNSSAAGYSEPAEKGALTLCNPWTDYIRGRKPKGF